MNTATIRFFHRDAEPDSLIAISGTFHASPIDFFISLILYSLERFREFDRYRRSNDENAKKSKRTAIKESGSTAV